MKNSLQTSTVKKIFREHFKGEVPIVKYDTEKKMLISEIEQKLRTMTGFVISDRYYRYRSELNESCYFQVHSPSEHYEYPEFTVTFNEQNELIIKKWSGLNSKVYELEQIYTLFDKMTSEFKRLDANYLKNRSKSESEQVKRENEQIKRKKIKDLKHKAIIAKIHEIAKEDQLEFYIRKYITKVKLVIRLAESEKMEIDIPYSKFQEIMQNLRTMIQTIREFHKSGITLKMRRTGYRDPEWISYKDEQDSS
ncbi:hypothetical protein [Candidatus Parabeggiatoa sp. HSG14]|uniref:hypothetical protein n=1 Tax=Candidatus Parabeggiatoa sp. HSG14 TaxID=3055593 RepID=UPI0025A84300|nr:hypothetical protein [Thiotrichales bacterium HSG14]